MKNLQKFEEFVTGESMNEKKGSITDQVYDAMGWLDSFESLGADQQGELVNVIVKKLVSFGIK